MNYSDALTVVDDLRSRIEPACEPGFDMICGSIRRLKRDVHDGEIIAKPLGVRPTPRFGEKIFDTHLDKILYAMESEGLLRLIKGGPKMKQYWVRVEDYGLQTLNGFKIEFYIVTPPAQWGVLSVIRTGPGSEDDNFSKWCVTNKSAGGGLPDGYKVKHGAVWTLEKLDAKLEPLKGESPMVMGTELEFLNFVGLDWIEPQSRHTPRRHVTR